MKEVKNEYISPCSDVIEIAIKSRILEDSPMENINPGTGHEWGD